jgi:hypothetical protein
MNGYHTILGGGKMTNGPYFAKDVNKFLSLLDPAPEGGLAVIVICEFLGLACNHLPSAYRLYREMVPLLNEYFKNIGVVRPRWIQYEEKMIDYCNFAWNRLSILAKASRAEFELQKDSNALNGFRLAYTHPGSESISIKAQT